MDITEREKRVGPKETWTTSKLGPCNRSEGGLKTNKHGYFCWWLHVLNNMKKL